ncbi:MAG: class D beta-lactamase [Proteobacteria bacterium]|nr:class D beta-lactamase [Pseudomonadota bacterium]MDA0993457.1 class D beta-lactamase [Pseudomonadota bacterium]
MSKFVILWIGTMIASAASGDTIVDPVGDIFQSEGVTGTLVIASFDGEIRHVYNEERSTVRLSPASTFKIFNTLIALDSGIVSTKESLFKWDGTDRGIPAWNRDQTLQSAFRVSCVWCYQEVARRVEGRRYIAELESVGYGNQRVGDRVDQFWLNGDLQISAVEQVDFLRHLVDYSIPYRREHIDIVKEIMQDEESAEYTLHAKTGWAGAGLGVGWYVGYVQRNDQTWLFAMNMQMDRAEQAPLRKDLVIRSLRALGIL